MAAYSYKEVVYREDYRKAIQPCMESLNATISDYDGDAGYDGDCWLVAAYLLEQKDREIAELRAVITKIKDIIS